MKINLYDKEKNLRPAAAVLAAIMSVILLSGCSGIGGTLRELKSIMSGEPETQPAETMISEDTLVSIVQPEPEDYRFVDAVGVSHVGQLQEEWEKNPYDPNAFMREGHKMTYEDENYTSRVGIDVSQYQGEVDWEQVRDSGYEFAIIRLALRGYGAEGNIKTDKYALANIEGALAAGLDIGVYFFSQAVNEDEAREEARYVIMLLTQAGLSPEDLKMPVVFDPETVDAPDARTANIQGEQFTANALAFCGAVEAVGYQPMIYSNMLWEAYKWDLGLLSGIPIWYADYEDVPQTPYTFAMWQYSQTSRVPGIKGNVDTDIQLVKKE